MTSYDTLLRSLDAAQPDVTATSSRARADLERILASDPAVDSRRPVPRRTARRVLVPLVSLAGVATAAVLALPSLTGGDRAFATWTPTPHPLSGSALPDAASQCRKAQAEGAGSKYAAQLASATAAVAEQRGDWTTVVLAGPGGFSALCVTDASTHLFKDWFGSIGAGMGTYASPAPRDVVATDLGVGTMNAGDLSLVAGYTGSDIVALSFASQSHGTVAATLGGGRFALWFPGDELRDAPSHGITLAATYRDGSIGTVELHLGR